MWKITGSWSVSRMSNTIPDCRQSGGPLVIDGWMIRKKNKCEFWTGKCWEENGLGVYEDIITFWKKKKTG